MIKTLSTRAVYENRWMRVREDRVRFAGGAEGVYGVVEKPDFALIVPRHDDGRIQLVEQYRYPVAGRYWECPQGSWDADADPEQLALGELEEETGLRAGTLRRIGYLYEAYGFSNQGFHVFVAAGLVPGAPRREESEADMRTAAFTLDQARAMIAAGTFRDAPSIAALGLLSLNGELT